MRLLLVEDDLPTLAYVARAFRGEGMTVETLENGLDARAAITSSAFDVVVMDVMLPGTDGLTLLRQLRARGITTPILLLSARAELDHRVEGLRCGADDYLAKPFAMAELVARVHALGRRNVGPRSDTWCLGDLTLDVASRSARRGARQVELTGREFRLLEFLMRNAGRICTRMMIFEKVWDYGFDPGTNIIDVYVRKLRDKVDVDPEPKLIHCVRGVGYVMKEPVGAVEETPDRPSPVSTAG